MRKTYIALIALLLLLFSLFMINFLFNMPDLEVSVSPEPTPTPTSTPPTGTIAGIEEPTPTPTPPIQTVLLPGSVGPLTSAPSPTPTLTPTPIYDDGGGGGGGGGGGEPNDVAADIYISGESSPPYVLNLDFGTLFPGATSAQAFTVNIKGTGTANYTITLGGPAAGSQAMRPYMIVQKDPTEAGSEPDGTANGTNGDYTAAGTVSSSGDSSDTWIVIFDPPLTSGDYTCQITVQATGG